MISEIISELSSEIQRCVNCGFCEPVCPTLQASGQREGFGARGRINLARAFLSEVEERGRSSLRLGDYINSCLSCYACLQACPAGVSAGRVSDLLKEVIADGRLLESRQEHPVARMIVSVTMKYMDPLGLREECAEWARGLEFDGGGPLLYTGHMYQLIPYIRGLRRALRGLEGLTSGLAEAVSAAPQLIRLVKALADRRDVARASSILRSIAALLRASGVRFSYLGPEEPYPGTLLYDMGYIREFSEYASRVHSILKEHGVTEVITVDPHTYDLLLNVYPKFVRGFSIRVRHYLELVRPELLGPRRPRRLTYHEPCHFVRRTGFNMPRLLLERTSELVMPKHSGRNTMCCGGPDEALYPEISEAVSEVRFRELKGTGAELIVTACPICLENLGKDESVIDISEWLAGLLTPPNAYLSTRG